MLVMEMSNKKQEIPAIRFNGFTYAWEQHKLRDYAKYRRGSFPQPYGNKEWYDGEGAEPFVQVVDVGDNLRLVDDTKQKISILGQSKSVFVPAGKVVVTLQGSIGRVAITQYDSFVDRTLLIFDEYQFQTNEYFWAYIIQQKFEIEKLKAPGGTIKTITKEALSDFEVHLPSYHEQKKVGSFFKQLDDTIALHQRQLDNYKELKKAMLQKIFNQELRFKNDDGNDYPDWREVILEEICLYKSSNISLNSFKEYNGEEIYPLYDANSLVLNIDKYDQENEYVSIIKDGAGVGRIRYCEGKSSVLGTMGYLLPTDTVDIKFLYFRLQIINFLSYVSGSTIPHIYFKDYKKENIGLPCEDEQKKIADVLSALDIKIEISVQKIEALKQQKKGFMQQMFV